MFRTLSNIAKPPRSRVSGFLYCSTMASGARKQPPWQKPTASGEVKPRLKVYNSLTRSKEDFVPIEPGKVSWYVCGPTVYDDAHLGHARNYVTTDIIRRIMADYFKFDVKFVMNITDVDDKIILRGRQRHLFGEFKQNTTSRDEVVKVGREALAAYIKKQLPLIAADTQPADVGPAIEKNYGQLINKKATAAAPITDQEAKTKMHINTVTNAAKALVELEKHNDVKLDAFYDKAEDIYLPYLDAQKGTQIDGNDHSIFTKLTQEYERRFMDDHRALNVLDPDILVRVTEYGDKIVDFVKKIEDNKFAYKTSDNSIYFDIDAFEAANNYYSRLEPWNRNDQSLQADGEGALTAKTTEKRSAADFALWKSSKPGEPSWPSPWGPGRPGWHIECSAMASDVLGSKIDIHSGGIDLAFPHHDNELAQSEAYWLDGSHKDTQHQWVNYFLHMGHLSIQGSKMSKSLKNFTTIREALAKQTWNPRSLRIIFLLGAWERGIEVTDDIVHQGASWEQRVNVNDILRRREESPDGSGELDAELDKALEAAKQKTEESLLDSFNTRGAMDSISDLTAAFFTLDAGKLTAKTIRDAARWVTSMVNTFGLNGDARPDSITVGWSGVALPPEATPYVYQLSDFRDQVRSKARSKDGVSSSEIKELVQSAATPDATSATANTFAGAFSNFLLDVTHAADSENLSKDILKLCDNLRDVELFDRNVYLEDREGQPALVRPVTEDLRTARREREDREKEKQRKKQADAAKAAEKAAQGKLSHKEMFRVPEYSAWDDDGLPTKDAEGQDLPKSKSKRLKKDWERQKKLHEAWLKTQA